MLFAFGDVGIEVGDRSHAVGHEAGYLREIARFPPRQAHLLTETNHYFLAQSNSV